MGSLRVYLLFTFAVLLDVLPPTPALAWIITGDINTFVFETGATERMRITSSGSVGIGTTSPAYKLDVTGADNVGNFTVAGATERLRVVTNASNVSLESTTFNQNAYAPLQLIGTTVNLTYSGTSGLFLDTSGYVGIGTTGPSYALHVNGTAYATGAAGALSDRRHKTGIEPYAAAALDVVARLKPVTFLWKEPKDEGMRGRQLGFIAQDVQEVIPEAVLTGNDEQRTLGLKYDSLIPVLAKAIQEQQDEIVKLEAANLALEQQVGQLQAQLADDMENP